MSQPTPEDNALFTLLTLLEFSTGRILLIVARKALQSPNGDTTHAFTSSQANLQGM